MSQFLWVESITNNTLRVDTENIFGELLHNRKIPNHYLKIKNILKEYGIFVEFTFLDSLEFIYTPCQLLQIDYIILDLEIPIPLGASNKNQLLVKILQNYYDYEPQNNKIVDQYHFEKAKEKLVPVAGYQLYIELVRELDFPKEHILFCASDISKQKTVRAIFEQAKIELPLLFAKTDREKLQRWVRERQENHYSILRRGIIIGCQYIQSLITAQQKKLIKLNKILRTDSDSPLQHLTLPDIQNYLETLQTILPLRQPHNPQPSYNLFIKQLTLKWDDINFESGFRVTNQYSFNWVVKCARQWLSHTTTLNQFSERDIGFLFIITMRIMFKFSETVPIYESILLNLFYNQPKNLSGNQLIQSRSHSYSVPHLTSLDNY